MSDIINLLLAVASPILWIPSVIKAAKDASSYSPFSLITSTFITVFWLMRGFENDILLAINSIAWIIVYLLTLYFYYKQNGFKLNFLNKKNDPCLKNLNPRGKKL